LHVTAPSVEATNWARIVSLYDTLLRIRPSPVVALNRAIAVAQHEGPEAGLEAVSAMADRERLPAYPFFPANLGGLERPCWGRPGALRGGAGSCAQSSRTALSATTHESMCFADLRDLVPAAPELC